MGWVMGKMTCPHCQAIIDDRMHESPLGEDRFGICTFQTKKCTACERWIVVMECKKRIVTQSPQGSSEYFHSDKDRIMVFPRKATRPPAPPEVPAEYAKDFNEACLILTDSPNAAAAQARRCLQNLIRNVEGLKERTLYDEIEALLAKGHLPSHITDDLHSIRDLGNIGAHPMKDAISGDVVDVDPEEGEWTLNLLESLFDRYFVEPEKAKKRRAKLQKKKQDTEK